MICHSLLQWTALCQTSPSWAFCLGWPHRAWPSFIELDKAVVLVWLDWLVFCEYGLCVCPLMSLTTPNVLLGFLLPWTWGHGSSSKAQLLILTLDKGYLLTAAPPDLERGVAPLSPPVPAQPPLLGRWVSPLRRSPWPQARGSSSRPRFCAVPSQPVRFCLRVHSSLFN